MCIDLSVDHILKKKEKDNILCPYLEFKFLISNYISSKVNFSLKIFAYYFDQFTISYICN